MNSRGIFGAYSGMLALATRFDTGGAITPLRKNGRKRFLRIL
jgi:hypothetical protein